MVSREKRRAMIEPSHPKLSLSRQCRLLRVSRSSVYHRPKGESAENLELMHRCSPALLIVREWMMRPCATLSAEPDGAWSMLISAEESSNSALLERVKVKLDELRLQAALANGTNGTIIEVTDDG